MDYLVDKYVKNPEKVQDLLNSNVSVSLKIDGSAFQVFYNKETDNIEYHKRAGSSNKLGPEITNYDKMFSKHLDDAITEIESKKDLLDDYKFLVFEIFNHQMILLNVVKRNEDVVEDPNELSDIAKKLNVETVPILYTGKLDKSQQEKLITLLSVDENISNDDFTNYLKDIFNLSSISPKLLKGNAIMEGIVLTFDGMEQYKVINPYFKKHHENEQAASKAAKEKYIEPTNDLISALYDALSKVAKKEDNDHLKSLELNFINICKNERTVSKLLELASKLPENTNEFVNLNIKKTSEEIQNLVKKYGSDMKKVYETFLQSFNKPKKRAFMISKEFQSKVNGLINSISEHKAQSLKNYIYEAIS